MATILLIIIYIGFISLGLPDSLFGASWPVMQLQFNMPVSYAGFATATVSVGTVISSLMSDRVIRRFGTGLITAVSVAMTAVALLGISFSTEYWMVIVFSVPLGLGAGAVDAALNNYVALNFAAKHMSWLHCFWGVGASISPYIMGYWLSRDNQWYSGYRTVGIIQVILVFLLFMSLPMWKKHQQAKLKEAGEQSEQVEQSEPKTIRQILAIKGVKSILLAFFAYCSIEAISFVWTSSYLVTSKGFSVEEAARWASLFYLGMTVSRLVVGFFADRLGDKRQIRIGYAVMFVGIAMVLLSGSIHVLCLVGLFITGVGCGPIYPSVIHSTPYTFGRENSQSIVGAQMAFAYCASTAVPPLFGLVAKYINIGLYPVVIVMFAIAGVALMEVVNRVRSQS